MTSTTLLQPERPRISTEWPALRSSVERDQSALIGMWLIAGVLVAAFHYLGRELDPVPTRPLLNLLIFTAWGGIAAMLAWTTVGRNSRWGARLFVHLLAISIAAALTLTLYLGWSAARPVRLSWFVARDSIAWLVAYTAVAMSVAVVKLGHRIADSTRRESELAAALASSQVRDAGSTAAELRDLLAEIRERLKTSANHAESFATVAAGVLRARLRARMSSEWTLADEVHLLDRELDLDRERSGHRTRLTIDASPELLAGRVSPGVAVDLWRRSAPSSPRDRDLALVAGGRKNGTFLSLQSHGIAIAERLEEPQPSSQRSETLALAEFGRFVAGHQVLAVITVAMAGVALGTCIVAMHRGALVEMQLGWLAFMAARALLGIIPALAFSRIVRLDRLRKPLVAAVVAFSAALMGEAAFAVLMHGFIFPPAPLPVMARRASGMALTSLCHPTIMALAMVNLVAVVRSIKDLVEHSDRLTEATVRFRSAQLRALRWQVNPHLLFNAMNSAAALIRAEPETADRFLGHLSNFYARLNTDDREFHPLCEELKMVTEYLAIETVRFPSLGARFDIDERLASREVPSLVLQPVIENAVKFGPPNQQIEVFTARDNGGWSISVRSQVASHARPGAGLGLIILEERLRGHYGDRAALQCRREESRNVTTIRFRDGDGAR